MLYIKRYLIWGKKLPSLMVGLLVVPFRWKPTPCCPGQAGAGLSLPTSLSTVTWKTPTIDRAAVTDGKDKQVQARQVQATAAASVLEA